MTGKIVYLLALLVSIAVVVIAVPSPYGPSRPIGSHDLIAGIRVKGDRLVLRQTVYKAAAWSQIVSIQRVFATSKYERITLLQALDQVTNGTGAYAHITKGGPGTSNATLSFQSQVGRGINFVVEVYSKP